MSSDGKDTCLMGTKLDGLAVIFIITKMMRYYFLISIFFSFGAAAQIDAVVLDELLREIVDSSMSDLRHRLQEAVFATSFRRKILEQHATSKDSDSSKSSSPNLEKLLDDYIKPQKLSLALETFTQAPPTKPTTSIPVQLVTADDMAIQESGRLFKDDVEYSEAASTWTLPRVPMYVAITVIVMCILTFLLLIGTVVYFLASRKKNLKMRMPRGMMIPNPDPLSVQGLSTCHVSPPNFSNSRRNSLYLDHQMDRATSSIWAHP